jgi:hypothetical protein
MKLKCAWLNNNSIGDYDSARHDFYEYDSTVFAPVLSFSRENRAKLARFSLSPPAVPPKTHYPPLIPFIRVYAR